MRILYIAEFFWPQIGGIEVLSDRMLRYMQREKGHKFAVITTNVNNNHPEYETLDNIEIYRFPFYEIVDNHNVLLMTKIQKRIIEIKKSFAPDLVHLQNCQGITAFFQLRTAKYDNCPMLLTVHGISESDFGDNTISKNILLSADWIVAVSNATLNYVRDYQPAIVNKSSVIYNGLPASLVNPASLNTDYPVLLCIGRVVLQKGFDFAIDAFAKLHYSQPNLKLIIAGDGAERINLERQVKDLNLEQYVTFTGWINPDQVPEMMNQATIVLMPSRWEPFGLVALQAAQMCRPVIGSDDDGLKEVITNEETGILFKKEDSSALASAIMRLLNDPEKMVAMGKAAQLKAEQIFGWDAFVNNYDNLYKKMIARKM